MQVIEITELTDLFKAIEMQVNMSTVDEDKKANLISNFQHLAYTGFQLGKNGKCELEVGEE